MNIVERIVCMWFDYNNECLDCIVSPFIQREINQILYEMNGRNVTQPPIKIDCDCLKVTSIAFIIKFKVTCFIICFSESYK